MKIKIMGFCILSFFCSLQSMITVSPRRVTPPSSTKSGTEAGSSLNARIVELALPPCEDDSQVDCCFKDPLCTHIKKLERSNPLSHKMVVHELEESNRPVARVHLCQALVEQREEIESQGATESGIAVFSHALYKRRVDRCMIFSAITAVLGFGTAIVVATTR